MALRHALVRHTPQVHHSDQGVQYESTAYIQTLECVGQAWQSGYAERLMRTIKEEVDLAEYENYGDAHRQIGRFLDEVYMHKRIHSSLGYLTPAEFETQWLTLQATPQSVY